MISRLAASVLLAVGCALPVMEPIPMADCDARCGTQETYDATLAGCEKLRPWPEYADSCIVGAAAWRSQCRARCK